MTRIEVLQVPDCPNAVLLHERLSQALADHSGDVQMIRRVIDDPDQAAAAGMTGSPTLLVDGCDPFAEPGQPPSVSCRLYRDPKGRLEGAPSVPALRAAIAATPENGGSLPGSLAVDHDIG